MGIAAGVPHIFAVMVSYLSGRRGLVWSIALCATGATILGTHLSAATAEGELWKAMTNRVLAITAIWVVAGFAARVITRERELTSANRVESLLDNLPVASIAVDETGTIIIANKMMSDVFGYPMEELIGRNVDTLVPESVQGYHSSLRDRFLSSSQSLKIPRILPALRKDGTELPIELTLNRVVMGGQDHALACVVDVSERVRLQEVERDHAKEMERTNDALTRSNEELQQFAYIASHDLQTPLRSISGFAQLLGKKHTASLDDEGVDYLSRISESAQQMRTLINDLLSYSRVDSRAQPFETVDLSHTMQKLLVYLEPIIQDAQAKVSVESLPEVIGDPNQLQQLLQNLVENALKYRSERKPEVRVWSRSVADHWEICVEDNGIGIAPEHHDRVFDIFRRLHTQREYPGTGIGLAVCQRVVHRHGGRTWVESTPGEGSRFFFSIPAAQRSSDNAEKDVDENGVS